MRLLNWSREDGAMDRRQESPFKRICVFCGSSNGNQAVFSDAALELGKELVARRIDLVYGGGSVGLMGLISRTVQEGGCHVVGVIPKALLPQEVHSLQADIDEDLRRLQLAEVRKY